MEEDRNCNCKNDNRMNVSTNNMSMDMTNMPNMSNMTNMTNVTNMSMPSMSMNNMSIYMNDSCGCNNDKEMTRQEMLKKIKCLKFAVVELALYLDTHPEDTKALCLHNKYCKELKEICDKYQKVYGPLTIEYPCNKWRWLEEPWPWEGGIE